MKKLAKAYLRAVYSLWAGIYDSLIDELFRFDRKKAIGELRISRKEKILEIGVGTGLNLPYYPKDCTVFGVDFSNSMLEKARRKQAGAKVILQKQDCRKTTFQANTFDKAIATYVLRVSPEPHKILKEISRVVSKNGLFVIVDQFKGKNRVLLALIQPFKIALGWGKEYNLGDLIKGTAWKAVSNTQFGKMSNTRLVVLKNNK